MFSDRGIANLGHSARRATGGILYGERRGGGFRPQSIVTHPPWKASIAYGKGIGRHIRPIGLIGLIGAIRPPNPPSLTPFRAPSYNPGSPSPRGEALVPVQMELRRIIISEIHEQQVIALKE